LSTKMAMPILDFRFWIFDYGNKVIWTFDFRFSD
jgi:hypothetical protein